MDRAYDFDLPPELIAQVPVDRRGDSRLLLVEPHEGPVGERVFRDLPAVLRPGDLLVVNESRVLPARLMTRRTDTGGRVEILLVRPLADPRTWQAMARPARRLREGVELEVMGAGGTPPRLTVRGRADDGIVTITGDRDLTAVAMERGEVPLPPYIRRESGDPRSPADRLRYQTVYATEAPGGAGSVAAPTAGLHFGAATLKLLEQSGVGLARVTLHVGPGTFQTPTDDQIATRRLHGEAFRLPADTSRELAGTRRRGGRVIAVGTTSLRVLETVARLDLPAAGGPDGREFDDQNGIFTGQALRCDGEWEVAGTTRLFVAPPDRVTSCDGLLTNFHLPGSSLIMLVAALAGDPAWRRTYAHAVEQGLRFYSYGDCMLVLAGLGPGGSS